VQALKHALKRDWCGACDKGIRLTIHVVPNARKSEVVGPLDDSLKIRLQARPIEGKANAALIRYLSESLNVPRTAVLVTHGLSSKHKLIEVQTAELTVADVKALLWQG
jgi:uncharacterized protein (TIGR00251 family)